MKMALLLCALAVGILFSAPALALSGGPAQYAPPYAYPSYCAQCLHPYRHVRHHWGRYAHAY
jgi:hypothetical protein